MTVLYQGEAAPRTVHTKQNNQNRRKKHNLERVLNTGLTVWPTGERQEEEEEEKTQDDQGK